MKIEINPSARLNGEHAAICVADLLNTYISRYGEARLLVSTGASQFEMFETLIYLDIDWTKVVMFHLDEYVGLPITHPASFRKYLTERFINHVKLKAAYLVDGEGDLTKVIGDLTMKINERLIDVGLIGIGENGHIAFNDPPADFETEEAYIVVDLDDRCKLQQVGEGWFDTVDDVPKQAISMTVSQIMKCKHIISVVPHEVKAEAVYDTLNESLTSMVPATMLKQHPDWRLYLDYDSAKLIYNNN